mmetsp:Transcript_8180/g.11009  ORF Transcript_8180/g.11009 Transcript_8180/m.11009 type:complete len:137 (-) Transcript_8180:47-457(-)
MRGLYDGSTEVEYDGETSVLAAPLSSLFLSLFFINFIQNVVLTYRFVPFTNFRVSCLFGCLKLIFNRFCEDLPATWTMNLSCAQPHKDAFIVITMLAISIGGLDHNIISFIFTKTDRTHCWDSSAFSILTRHRQNE